MLHKSVNIAVILLGSFMVAAGFNLFLVPHKLLSGGVSGISMILGYYTDWNIGLLYFVLNVPLMIWGWFAIGRKFIVLTILSVSLTSWLMQVIPTDSPVSDPILASVFGGVIAGIGVGLTLRFNGSTGGFDIIGFILTAKRDFPLGNILFALNGVVILALGYMDNWDSALYSMLSIFISSKLIDFIHIRHEKITAFIITNQTDEMLSELLLRPRGVTIIHTRGAYSHDAKDMLMTVTTRYELSELRHLIKRVDPKAFVNIVETVGIIGQFSKLK
jgi:uncharacterized membrane-anchored protein YitT (DUF2179 family)